MKEKDAVPGSCDWVPADGKEDGSGASCDWGLVRPETAINNESRFHPFAGDGWQGVEAERYKAEGGGWASIARHVLVGARGESSSFDLRYFEIAPGGYSSLEKHVHAHVVVCVHGRGRALLGGEVREMAFLDTAYIAGDDPHQLLNPFEEPFGFFCIVDRDRDRPRGLGGEELQTLLDGPAKDRIRP